MKVVSFSEPVTNPERLIGTTFNLASEQRRELMVELTAEDAKWLLGRMHPGQRTQSQRDIAAFETKMRTGKFITPSDPGIYVDRQGRVCNGQHRLQAQANTGVTLLWRITLGVGPEEIQALDQVRSRQIHQSINLTIGGAPMSKREEAAIRQYLRLQSSKPLSLVHEKIALEDVLAIRELFTEDLAWALNAVPTAAGPASLAAVAAWTYPTSPGTVAEFFSIVSAMRRSKPVQTDEDHPAIAMVRFLDNVPSFSGTQASNDVLEKGCTAIWNALHGKTLKKLYVNSDALPWFRAWRKKNGLST